MLKIMRACIGVQKPEDLWIFKEGGDKALEKLDQSPFLDTPG